MDSSATDLLYSFDGREWKSVTKFVKTMICRRGTIHDKRCTDPAFPTIYVKYLDEKGDESQVYQVPNKLRDEARLPPGLGQPKTLAEILGGNRK